MKGKIYRIHRDHGFAFIRDEEGHSRFMHAKEIGVTEFDHLQEGQTVEFIPDNKGEKGNGLRALEVRLCSN